MQKSQTRKALNGENAVVYASRKLGLLLTYENWMLNLVHTNIMQLLNHFAV